METFQGGEYVLVARAREVPKLAVTWTGPGSVVIHGKYVYKAEDSVTSARVGAYRKGSSVLQRISETNKRFEGSDSPHIRRV